MKFVELAEVLDTIKVDMPLKFKSNFYVRDKGLLESAIVSVRNAYYEKIE